MNESEYVSAHSLAFEVYVIALIAYDCTIEMLPANVVSTPFDGNVSTFIVRFATFVSTSLTCLEKSIVSVPVIAFSNDVDTGRQLKTFAAIVTVPTGLSPLLSSTAL